MRSKLTVVYGFDIESEIKYFELSLKTLLKSNGTKYKVVTFVSNNSLKNKVMRIYEKLNIKDKFDVVILEDIGFFRKQGKFYWLRSPFYIDSKYILQLDNDTLINTKLCNIIKNRNSKKFAIYGVRVKTPNSHLNSLVKTYENFNKNDLENIKWLNAGIILIDVEKYIKYFGDKNNLEQELLTYSKLSSQDEKLPQSDEIFIMNKFSFNIGTIPRRYNLRFQSPKTTDRWINSNDYIFHYNLRKKTNETFVKYNFDEILFSDFNLQNNIKKMKIFIDSVLISQNDHLINAELYLEKVLKKIKDFNLYNERADKMFKILFLRSYIPQIAELISVFERDCRNNNLYKIYKNFNKSSNEKNIISNDELNSYDLIITDNGTNVANPKFKKTNPNLTILELTHGVWFKKPYNQLLKKSGFIDYVLAPNKYSVSFFKKSGYKKNEIIKSEFPRMNFYRNTLDKDLLKKIIFTKHSTIEGKEIILYCPTWLSKTNDSVDVNLNYIYQKMNKNQILLISPHNLEKYKKKQIKYFGIPDEKFIILEDDIFWPNGSVIQGEEIMNISSKLITDYSSIIVDYVNLFGSGNAEYFFPDLDFENQSQETIDAYRINFSDWDLLSAVYKRNGNPKFRKSMSFYKSDNNNLKQEIIKILLKKINT